MRDDKQLARAEQALLLPSSAPRPALRPPSDASDGRYGNTSNEQEYAALHDQLGALARDIARARVGMREASELHLQARREPAPPPARGEVVVLPDGSRIAIRPIEPGDAPAVRAGFEHLADVSRYRRFLTSIEHLSREQLHYLTRVDHHHHEALAALDAASGEGIGIARYMGDPKDARQAEAVVVVADDWTGRGVGSALAERLAARARAEGFERVTARLLIADHVGRRLLERVAEPIAERRDGGTVRLTARLRG
jgi:RimJ/RimL family protein N-acetyltransferase